MEDQNQATVGSAEPQVITTSAVLALLKEGKSRKEINEHFQLNTATAKALWSQAGLKRMKQARPGKEVTVKIVDDVVKPTAKAEKAPKTEKAPVAETTTQAVAADSSQQAIADAANAANTEAPAATEAAKPAEGTAPAAGGWGS